MSIPERQYGCPVEVTMEALGGKWKATILWWLRRSAKRPSELRQLIPRISQKVLTTQLQELEVDGLIDRQTYRETPPRVEYSLTPLGESLRSLVEQMAEWGKQKMPEFQFGIINLAGITILIVGDEATTQALQVQFTMFYGATVATASTIPGLEHMRQLQPDVVLADLDGDETSASLQGQGPRSLQSDLVPPVPVIALTTPQGRGQAFAQGFRMVLIKPVDAVELVAAIASVTERLG